MLLHKAGVDYENKVISFEEFGKIKASGILPAGQVPIWTDECGNQLNQSNAILRMLGRQHGFYDESDATVAFQIDWVLETSLDFYSSKGYMRWFSDEVDEAKDEESAQAFN